MTAHTRTPGSNAGGGCRLATIRSSLSRHVGRSQATDEDLREMRRAVWRQQRVAVFRPDDIRDEWLRRAIINEANRLYGRNQEDK